MKLSKASPEEIDRLENFLNFIEEYFRFGSYSPRGENGEESEEEPQELNPEQFVEVMKELWQGGFPYYGRGVNSTWGKITFGYRTLVENSCDPDLSFLEWRPDIKGFLDSTDEKG